MESRGAVYQQFNLAKAKDPEVAKEFEACGRSYEQQRLFRLQWCKGQYEKMRSTRTKTETMKQSSALFGNSGIMMYGLSRV